MSATRYLTNLDPETVDETPIDEEREPTQVTQIIRDFDEQLRNSKLNLERTVGKADKLARRLRRAKSEPELRAVLTPVPPAPAALVEAGADEQS